MQMPDNQQIAVVTGAAGDFGREIVRRLLAEGFYVAATDIVEEKLKELPKYVDFPERLGLFYMDVSSPESIQKTAEQIATVFGDSIVILVNNAGVFERTPILLKEYYDTVKKIMDINLLGCYYSRTYAVCKRIMF